MDAGQSESLRRSADRRLTHLDYEQPSPPAISPQERERQRFEHLVLGRPRPRETVTLGKRAGRRKPVTVAVPVQLAPSIEAEMQVRERWSHKNQGTAQTHEHFSRHQEGSLSRLWQSGSIDADQLASAVAIAQVAERIGSDVTVKTASLETRIDSQRRHDTTFFEKLGAVRREVAYTRWRAEVSGPIAAVLDMIVGGIGFSVVAERHRMHHRKAKRLLLEALDLWPRILGDVCKEIDGATLAAAHAGILS